MMKKYKVLNDLSQWYCNNKTAKVNIRLYKEMLDARNYEDDDNDSIVGITESQQELMEDHMETEDVINLLTNQITKNTAKLDGY